MRLLLGSWEPEKTLSLKWNIKVSQESFEQSVKEGKGEGDVEGKRQKRT